MDSTPSAHAPSSPSRRGAAHALSGPIAPAILRLAAPTVLVLVVQTMVGVAETYFVSFLGTEALAGVTLVFPVLMLMQMMANGGIGGGTAAAIARASGAGRYDDANALLWHSIVLACGLGVVFSAVAFLIGSRLYHAMGGTGATLSAAVTYSMVVFSAAVPIWLTAMMSSALRGAGNARFPAVVTISGTFVLLPLSPVLIFGWGPFPALGVAGAGLAVAVYYLITATWLFAHLLSAGSVLQLRPVPLEWRLFAEILGVGLLSAIGTVQVNVTVTVITAAVGRFGTDALAGYGIASRLDYLQIPILFGLGTAIVTLVGINIGANQIERARQIAWTGAGMAFAFSTTVGLVVTIWPQLWMGLFTDDPVVAAQGALYLHIVAPFYGAVGLGLALYFASQAAKRVFLPVLAGTVRMVIAAFLGWTAVAVWGVNLMQLYWIVAVAAALYGMLTAFAISRQTWK